MGALKGKVALISGAGRGFGLAIAERFLEEGAGLALNYRQSRANCQALVERAQAARGRAIALQADLADGPAVERMVEQALSELGQIDILVNNAGIMHLGAFADSEEASWREELEINVVGTLRLTRFVVPEMKRRGAGKIINLSSQVAYLGMDNAAVYAGTKGFLLSWTKSLAGELGRFGINVNAIGPGSIPTDMNAAVYPSDEARRRRAEQLPLRRLGSPRDVAECALFLASDASDFLTGQMLGPNGGNLML